MERSGVLGLVTQEETCFNKFQRLISTVTPKSVSPQNGPPGLILAEILPKLIPLNQIWQPKSVRGDQFWQKSGPPLPKMVPHSNELLDMQRSISNHLHYCMQVSTGMPRLSMAMHALHETAAM